MIYAFGDVRVDVAARLLSRGPDTVHLTRKAFELLVLLLEHRQEVVSKEQIHGRLWPDTFVSDSSVQGLVSEIRRALGDEGPRPAWIRTVHGVGYAFGGEAAEIGARHPPSDAPPRAWLVAGAWKVPLRDGDNVLGRSGDDVTVIDAATISRRHARVHIGDAVWVEDLGSKNGTWVRDQRVTGPTPVADGDALRLGSLLFTFRAARGDDSTDTMSKSAAP